MHGNIDIQAFDRFANQKDHAGSLTGSIDFNAAPFGKGMPASRGVFNLFKPGGKGKEGLKNFVYEMAFEHEGKPYYLAGRKDVREAGDLWKDTTTLYTKLHEGKDSSGKVVGAGVLTLGAADLCGSPEHGRGPQRRQRRRKAGSQDPLRPHSSSASCGTATPGTSPGRRAEGGHAMDFEQSSSAAASAARSAPAGWPRPAARAGAGARPALEQDATTRARPGDRGVQPGDPELWNGWLDLRVFTMAVVPGAAVGGGSMVYANISLRRRRSDVSTGAGRPRSPTPSGAAL